jgi:hypothetical protein
MKLMVLSKYSPLIYYININHSHYYVHTQYILLGKWNFQTIDVSLATTVNKSKRN